MQIHWTYSPSAGGWHSGEQRFHIYALYGGRTIPDSYKLCDRVWNKEYRVDTVMAAKAKAVDIIVGEA
jgi:hypothetical protein